MKQGLYIILILILAGCRKDPSLNGSLDERIAGLGIELQTLPPVKHPDDNLSTTEKKELGRLLFWDPILSGEKDIACGSCHHPDFGYADGLDLSIGVGGSGLGSSRTEEAGGRIPRVGRNSQTVLNTAYNGIVDHHDLYDPSMAEMFWDSRVKSLEEQSLHPLASYNEMSGDAWPVALAADCVVTRLQNIPAYVNLFSNAFPGDSNAVSRTNLAKAIAVFERSLVSTNSRFDQYAKGEKNALNEDEKEGLLLFFTDAGCFSCHKGPMFSDYRLVVHGAADNPEGNFPDPGANGTFSFRTPSLRNISLTAPYGHGGVYETLSTALHFYNMGRSDNPEVDNSELDPHVKPLHLNHRERLLLEEFLKTLTDENFDRNIPASVPSGLKPGGNI